HYCGHNTKHTDRRQEQRPCSQAKSADKRSAQRSAKLKRCRWFRKIPLCKEGDWVNPDGLSRLPAIAVGLAAGIALEAGVLDGEFLALVAHLRPPRDRCCRSDVALAAR